MASLRLTFSDVYKEVADIMGYGSNPTGQDLIDVKKIVMRAYRRWLMPIDSSTGRLYQWSFLRQTSTLTITNNVDTYTLPSGFGSLETPFTHTSPLSYNPVQKSLDFIYQQKSAYTGTSVPLYFALKSGNYDQVNGQKWEVIFCPIPNGEYEYYYVYNIVPQMLVEDNDYFIGSELGSETILQLALATAETQKNNIIGVHNQLADVMLQQAIGADKQTLTCGNLGQMWNGKGNEKVRHITTVQFEGTQILPEP